MDSLFDVFNTGVVEESQATKGGTAAVVYHQEDVTGKKRGKEEHAGATQEPASKKLKEDGVDEDAGGQGQKKAETLTADSPRPMPEIVTLTNIDEAPRPDRKTCRHEVALPVSYSVEQVKGSFLREEHQCACFESSFHFHGNAF